VSRLAAAGARRREQRAPRWQRAGPMHAPGALLHRAPLPHPAAAPRAFVISASCCAAPSRAHRLSSCSLLTSTSKASSASGGAPPRSPPSLPPRPPLLPAGAQAVRGGGADAGPGPAASGVAAIAGDAPAEDAPAPRGRFATGAPPAPAAPPAARPAGAGPGRAARRGRT
jgi:hypothetical protein